MRIDLPAFRFLIRGRFWLRLWDEINRDNCWGMAAQLSYYFLLAFFPFLLFLSALIGFMPIRQDLVENFIMEFGAFMPDRSFDMVHQISTNLLQSKAQGALTFGILTALWFASLSLNGMISLLNLAYQAEEHRSYFLTRSLAIVVTVIVSVFLVASGVLLFFGDWVSQVLVNSPFTLLAYSFVRWITIFVLLNVGIQIVYYALPAKRFPWRLISPGGVVATTGWIIGSMLFRYWVNHFGNFQQLWGSLGALIALMIWFYICSFCLLLGGEIDSEIFKMRREIHDPNA